MPHLRQNAATKEWVIFAPERASRPEILKERGVGWTHERTEHQADCPLCPGQEDEFTPGETLRYCDAGGRWLVRACPNRYPALAPGAPPQRDGGRFERRMDAVGQHEVIVESRLHNTTLALQSVQEVALVVRAWQERYRALRQRPETEHVSIYKNHGVRGGTSLAHPHSQAVTLPVTPHQVRRRMEEAMRYHNDYGECVYCHMLWREKVEGQRLVAEGKSFVAFIPFAAGSPFLTWIVPHRHGGCMSLAEEHEVDDFAALLRTVLARLYHGLGDPDYNLVFRAASRDYLEVPFAHWYAVLIPRISTPAGFELGTGMFINTHLPERDAEYLRSVEVP